MSNEKWRLFFAIPFSYDDQEYLRQSLTAADIQLPERIIAPKSWHITLYFIGATSPADVQNLMRYFSSQSWPKKFELSLDHMGAFPEPEKAKIFWCGIGKGETELSELVKKVALSLYESGFGQNIKFDAELYHGHVTLSRLKEPRDLTQFTDKMIRPVNILVDHFVLFRSHSEIGEQQYEVLASFNLS